MKFLRCYEKVYIYSVESWRISYSYAVVTQQAFDTRIRYIYSVRIMSNVLLSIKTDEQTKRDLKAFASELGMTTTTLINVVIRQALRNRRVVLTTGLTPTPYLENIITEVE